MNNERLYLVAYDISDPKRWRRVFRLMNGYGEWLQLSLFQCRLNAARHAELIAMLDEMIHHHDDHLLCIDLGLADKVEPRFISIGKAFAMVEKGPIII